MRDKEHYLKYQKEYREKNKILLLEKKKYYYIKNKKYILKRKAEYVSNNIELIKEQDLKSKKKHWSEIKVKINKRRKERNRTDLLFKLSNNIRSKIGNSFRQKNIDKKEKTLEYLGCSINELKEHLESKFEDWMTWDNYGKYPDGWDIDHIIPLSSAKTEKELCLLFNYTNLQPLNSKINRHIKRDNY